MAYDAFLKLDGINGESVDSQYKDWIEVLSFSWGMSNAVSIGSGGGTGAGKVSFQDFHFVMSQNKSSAKLMSACATGQHIKSAELNLRKAGGDAAGKQEVFLKYELTDVLVSGIAAGGAEQGDDRPVEDVTLAFVKIDFAYTAPDGELDEFVWDVSQNRVP